MAKKPGDIIEDGDKILDGLSFLDRKLYNRVVKFLIANSDRGKISISANDLAGLEDLLYDEIKKSEYEKELNKYLLLFETLAGAISQQQAEINRLKIAEINAFWGDDSQRRAISEKVIYDLGARGMKLKFVKAVADAVRDVNYYNMDFNTAEQTIKTFLIDNEYTQRYIGQTVRDSLSQYQGAMNNRIATVYGFKRWLYVGNTIETTRPICAHLRDDLGGEFTDEQLKKALQEYCPNGEPSDSKITYSTVSGKKYTKKKGSGMIKGTTFDNFPQVRGGYGCRHECIPII